MRYLRAGGGLLICGALAGCASRPGVAQDGASKPSGIERTTAEPSSASGPVLERPVLERHVIAAAAAIVSAHAPRAAAASAAVPVDCFDDPETIEPSCMWLRFKHALDQPDARLVLRTVRGCPNASIDAFLARMNRWTTLRSGDWMTRISGRDELEPISCGLEGVLIWRGQRFELGMTFEGAATVWQGSSGARFYVAGGVSGCSG